MRKVKAVKEVTLKELKKYNRQAPIPTKSYGPYPHYDFVVNILNRLKYENYVVGDEFIQVSMDGTRLFGTATIHVGTVNIKNKNSMGGFMRTKIGFRNSYDKSIAAGFCIGAEVMVCSNMSFYSDLVVSHKHTVHILFMMDKMIKHAIHKISIEQEKQHNFFVKMMDCNLSKAKANEIMLNAVENKIIDGPDLKVVRSEWTNPSFDEFKAGTKWCLYNAFTTAMKRGFTYTPTLTMSRSLNLTKMFMEN